MQDDPGAGHADGVSQGDRATVDVDLVLADAELPCAGDADRSERLVDLDQIQVGDLDALLGAGLPDGHGGLGLQGRVGSGDLT